MSDYASDSDENEVPAIHLSSPNLLNDRDVQSPLIRASTAPAEVEPLRVDPILGHSSHRDHEKESDNEQSHSKRSEHKKEKEKERRKRSRLHRLQESSKKSQPQAKVPNNSGFDPVEFDKNGSVFGVNGGTSRWIPGPLQTSPYDDRNMQWVMQQQQQRPRPPQFSSNPDIFGISTSPIIREVGDDADEIIFPPLDGPLRRRRGTFSDLSSEADPNIRKISGDERDFLPDFRIPQPKEKNNNGNGNNNNGNGNGKLKSNKKQKSWSSTWKDVSPAIYIAAMSIAFIVVHQKELLEQYINQVVQILFSCITNLALGGGVLAVILLAVRILTSSTVFGLFSKQNSKSDNGNNKSDANKMNKTRRESDIDMLRQSMLRPPGGGFRYSDAFTPIDTTNPRPFGLRSYSQPIISGPPTPSMYLWERAGRGLNSGPMSPAAAYPWERDFGRSQRVPQQPPQQQPSGPFSPNMMPPMMGIPAGSTPYFRRGSSFDSRQQPPQTQASASNDQRPPIVKIPITNDYPEYPLPEMAPTNGHYEYPGLYEPPMNSRRESLMSESPFPDYYLDEAPVQEVVDKEKRTTFSNPVKVVFKRREPGQEEPGATPAAEPVSMFTDQFSSKPYGPPPRRYRGINV